MERIKSAAEHVNLQVDFFRKSASPLLGLDPSWRGFRFLDGYDVRSTTLHGDVAPVDRGVSYHLGHAAGFGPGDIPFVIVTTSTGFMEEEMLPWHLIVRAERKPVDGPISSDVPRDAVSRTIEWDVDGHELDFSVLIRGEAFAASHTTDARSIVVIGFGVAPAVHPLRTITDLDPYVAGFTERSRRFL